MRQPYEINQYVSYDTSLSEDLIANAEALVVALAFIPRWANGWKWAIIAADMLATTALVVCVNDSSGTAALIEPSRSKWLELIEGKWFDPVPAKRVAALRELLEIAIKPVPGDWRRPLKLEARDIENLTELHEMFRNELIHFKANGLSIIVDGLPAWIGSAITVAEAGIGTRKLTRATGVRQSKLRGDTCNASSLVSRRLLQDSRARLASRLIAGPEIVGSHLLERPWACGREGFFREPGFVFCLQSGNPVTLRDGFVDNRLQAGIVLHV